MHYFYVLDALAAHPDESTYEATSEEADIEQDLANLIVDPTFYLDDDVGSDIADDVTSDMDNNDGCDEPDHVHMAVAVSAISPTPSVSSPCSATPQFRPTGLLEWVVGYVGI